MKAGANVEDDGVKRASFGVATGYKDLMGKVTLKAKGGKICEGASFVVEDGKFGGKFEW